MSSGESCGALWAGTIGRVDPGRGGSGGKGSGKPYGGRSVRGGRISRGWDGGYARVGQADGTACGIAAARCRERDRWAGALLCRGTRLQSYGDRLDGRVCAGGGDSDEAHKAGWVGGISASECFGDA